MDNAIAEALKEIVEQLKMKNDQDERFRSDLMEELRRMNRTLDRMYDKEIGGPI